MGNLARLIDRGHVGCGFDPGPEMREGVRARPSRSGWLGLLEKRGDAEPATIVARAAPAAWT